MSNITKYESCKSKKIYKIIKEFEEGKLKTRSNQKIKSKKQAIAIGLTTANSKCEKLFSDEDYKLIEERFNKNIYINGELKNSKVSYTTIKSGIKLYEYYKKKKNIIKANQLKDDMILIVLKNIKLGNVNHYIIKELIHFLEGKSH